AGCLRRMSTATLTTANTANSSSEVVPPRDAVTVSGRTVVTAKMSAEAMSVVKMIDTHGDRRPAMTFANTGGSTVCLAMPYSRRLAMSMLSSAEFATANIVMNGKIVSIGTPGAPALTTSSRGVSLSVRTPIGTAATVTMDTST